MKRYGWAWSLVATVGACGGSNSPNLGGACVPGTSVASVALTQVDVLGAPVCWEIASSYEGGSITEWLVHPVDDLDGRTAATQRLQIEPDLHDVAPSDMEDALAEAYGAPVRLRSDGPTTRHVRSGWS